MYLEQIDCVRESVHSTIVAKGKEISKVVGAEHSPLLGVLSCISRSNRGYFVSTDIRDVDSDRCLPTLAKSLVVVSCYGARWIPGELGL